MTTTEIAATIQHQRAEAERQWAAYEVAARAGDGEAAALHRARSLEADQVADSLLLPSRPGLTAVVGDWS